MSSTKERDKSFVMYIDEPPINPYVETFFHQYASIPKTELRDHLIDVRNNAWNKFHYPCLGRWNFLNFSIRENPIYKEIVDQCKNQGATLIDFGCCLGQDIRQLVYDGVSLKQLRGYELDPFFVQQGYQLFRDEKLMKENQVFESGDVFNDQFLESIIPSDYLYVGSFIHLFDHQTQKDVCHRLSRLSKQAILGRQVGSSIAEEREKVSGAGTGKMMCHSPESFRNMWNEVTNDNWQVEYANLNKISDSEDSRQLLTFVVRKIN